MDSGFRTAQAVMCALNSAERIGWEPATGSLPTVSSYSCSARFCSHGSHTLAARVTRRNPPKPLPSPRRNPPLPRPRALGLPRAGIRPHKRAPLFILHMKRSVPPGNLTPVPLLSLPIPKSALRLTTRTCLPASPLPPMVRRHHRTVTRVRARRKARAPNSTSSDD